MAHYNHQDLCGHLSPSCSHLSQGHVLPAASLSQSCRPPPGGNGPLPTESSAHGAGHRGDVLSRPHGALWDNAQDADRQELQPLTLFAVQIADMAL